MSFLLLLNSIMGGSPPACPYPLNDNGATLSGLGAVAFDTTADPERDIGVLVTDGTAKGVYISLREVAGAPAMPATGIVGYAMKYLSVPHDAGMTSFLRGALITAYLDSAGAVLELVIYYANITSASTFDVVADFMSGAPAQTVATDLDIADILTTELGIYVDAETGDIGFKVNGVDSDFIGYTPPAGWAKLSPGIGIHHDATGVDGLTYSAQFLYGADSMTLEGWPSGAVDLCGDPLPGLPGGALRLDGGDVLLDDSGFYILAW